MRVQELQQLLISNLGVWDDFERTVLTKEIAVDRESGDLGKI